MITVIWLSTACILLTFSGLSLFKRLLGHRILDMPNQRSSHNVPVPRGGGFVIAFVCLVAGSIIAAYPRSGINLYDWSFFYTGAGMVAITGLIDDFRGLSSTTRFIIQSMTAILAIASLGSFSTLFLPSVGPINLGWTGVILAFFWIVGLTNAYNFMDGIDGIAGAQGVVAATGWVILGYMSDNSFVALVGLLLATSCFGFLLHNWNPATVFMGDVGSCFLGYSFAVLPVVAAAQIDSRMALTGLLFVWPFVFDSSFTFIRRLINRENVFAAHRSHLYQRLVICGMSHSEISLLYALLAAMGVILGLMWFLDIRGSSTSILTTVPLAALALCLYTGYKERGLKKGTQGTAIDIVG